MLDPGLKLAVDDGRCLNPTMCTNKFVPFSRTERYLACRRDKLLSRSFRGACRSEAVSGLGA